MKAVVDEERTYRWYRDTLRNENDLRSVLIPNAMRQRLPIDASGVLLSSAVSGSPLEAPGNACVPE